MRFPDLQIACDLLHLKKRPRILMRDIGNEIGQHLGAKTARSTGDEIFECHIEGLIDEAI